MTRAVLVAAVLLAACGASEVPHEHPHHDHASGHPGARPHGRHGRHGHHGHHDFSDVERFAAMFDDPARDEWQRPAEVVALLELEPGMVVADLGTGTGYFVPHLARAVGPSGRVLALDTEPRMVEHVRERVAQAGLANVEQRVVAPEDPGLAPASVDRILIVDTWHHIAERERYAARLRAALREGGFVLVVDFTPESPHGPPPEMRLSADAVVRELEAGGLAARVLDEALPYQYVVRAEASADRGNASRAGERAAGPQA